MQETRIWSLVWEDLKSHRATKPVYHNYWASTLEPVSCNYWAHVPRAYALQQEKLLQGEAQAPQQRVTPALRNQKKAHSQQRSPSTTKTKQIK